MIILLKSGLSIDILTKAVHLNMRKLGEIRDFRAEKKNSEMRIYFEKFGKSAEMRIFLDILNILC